MFNVPKLACAVLIAAFLGVVGSALADVNSGPTVGEPVPALKTVVVIGESGGQTVDLAAQRGQKATIYCLIPAEKFARPTYRLLKGLNEKIAATQPEGQVIVVWVTGTIEDSKSYLERARNSLQGDRLVYGVADSDSNGPANWGYNSDADLTVVVARDGRVAKTFGFVSPNDTLVDEVLKAF